MLKKNKESKSLTILISTVLTFLPTDAAVGLLIAPITIWLRNGEEFDDNSKSCLKENREKCEENDILN